MELLKIAKINILRAISECKTFTAKTICKETNNIRQ